MKLQTYDSSLFIDLSYIINYRLQNFLIFQPVYKTFKVPSAGLTDTIAEWYSKGLWNERIRAPFTTNCSLHANLRWMNNSRIILEFKEDKVTFASRNLQ